MQKESEARHRLEVGRKVVARMGHAEMAHGFDQWVAGAEMWRTARVQKEKEDALSASLEAMRAEVQGESGVVTQLRRQVESREDERVAVEEQLAGLESKQAELQV